jgi:hypothetical protein
MPLIGDMEEVVLGGGWDGRVFAYKCKNCGYVEFYFEK